MDTIDTTALEKIYETTAATARTLFDAMQKANMPSVTANWGGRAYTFAAKRRRTNVGYWDWAAIDTSEGTSGNLLETEPEADYYVHRDFGARSWSATLDDVATFNKVAASLAQEIADQIAKTAGDAASASAKVAEILQG